MRDRTVTRSSFLSKMGGLRHFSVCAWILCALCLSDAFLLQNSANIQGAYGPKSLKGTYRRLETGFFRHIVCSSSQSPKGERDKLGRFLKINVKDPKIVDKKVFVRGLAKVRRLTGLKNSSLMQIVGRMQFNQNSLVASGVLISLWLIISTWYIGSVEQWKVLQSFFYVVDTGLARGFGAVKPITPTGQVFTIVNELVGAVVAAILLGQFAQRILENAKEAGAVAKITRLEDDADMRRLCANVSTRGAFKSVPVDITGDGVADGIGVDTTGDGTVDTVISYERPQFVTAARLTLTAALGGWVALGAAYGGAVEGWDAVTSLFFAVTTLGIGGLQAPQVDSSGALVEWHAAAVAVYVLVGVPLFTAAVGDLAGYFLEDSLRQEERAAMDRPIELRDFQIASNLIDSDGELGKSEYILLELMRLGKTDVGAIAVMAQRFERMDSSGDGALDVSELEKYNRSMGENR